MNSDVTDTHIHELLLNFETKLYENKDTTEDQEVIERCAAILNLDYNILEISNNNGELSRHYPSRLLIPESQLASTATNGSQQTIYEHTIDATRLREHFQKARSARCRARFPVPVILYRGKYICRSATLSSSTEMYGRSGIDTLSSWMGISKTTSTPTDIEEETDNAALEAEEHFSEFTSDFNEKSTLEIEAKEKTEDRKNYVDTIRAADIKLIKYLRVGTIVDLMVENKKVKYGVNVTSSEKVDKERRYDSFRLAALPYPGCEFFKLYRDNSHSTSDLVYDWTQNYNDAKICVPDITPPMISSISSTSSSSTVSKSSNSTIDAVTRNCTSSNSNSNSTPLNIQWENYHQWDLQVMTQNYLRLMLHYIDDNSSDNGMLVHCISGWDRTPLFISLLRISLWADGAIHQSLSPAQMLYFTIAYDWYLFGHNLPDRLSKGEDILFFCFYILKQINDRQFCSVSLRKNRCKSNSSSGSSNNSGSSIGIIRTDIDSSVVENNGMLFDGADSNLGSNLSLNSMGSARSSNEPNERTQFQFDFQHRINGNGPRIHRDSNNSVNSDLTDNANCGSIESIFTEIQVAANIAEHENANVNLLDETYGIDSVDGVETCLDNATSNNIKRTSPVSVPRSSAIGQRHRNDSVPSVSGSWQFISTTGSVRSPEPPLLTQNLSSVQNSINGEGIDDNPMNEILQQRRIKLQTLRELFYPVYYATIDITKGNGPLFSGFLTTFAGRVGLASKTL